MKLAYNIKIGGGVLLTLNLLMAFGCIWVFIRMAPAIEVIIEQNERSLYHCEQMLACLAYGKQTDGENKDLEKIFSESMEKAEKNITEDAEGPVLETIRLNYKDALNGVKDNKQITLDAILELSRINREAMVKADTKAQQLGNAGAWGVVFMATIVFLTGLLFIRSLKNYLIQPLEEISTTVNSYRNGETMRRCTGVDLPRDIKAIFDAVNDVLDKNGQFK